VNRYVRAALACAALLALPAAWAVAPAAAASAAPPETTVVAEVEIQPGIITVGSLARVELRVEMDREDRVEWASRGWNLGAFELRSVEPPRRKRLPGNRVRETLLATVASFDVGPQVLAGPVVRVSGHDSLSLRMPSVTVMVQSVLRPEDKQKDIRDIKGAVPWRRPLPVWAWVALIAAGALLLGTLVVWLVRRWLRRRREAELRLPAHVRALRDLDLLRKSDLLRTNRTKDYHVRLTEVLRRYLGERCGFAALDLTTAELLEKLESALPGERDELRRILEASDLVKFARVTPGPGVPESLLESAVQVVERTRPREPGEVAA
jgi:hypothetical protein